MSEISDTIEFIRDSIIRVAKYYHYQSMTYDYDIDEVDNDYDSIEDLSLNNFYGDDEDTDFDEVSYYECRECGSDDMYNDDQVIGHALIHVRNTQTENTGQAVRGTARREGEGSLDRMIREMAFAGRNKSEEFLND